MLFDNKKCIKAKQYQCVTVDEETHLLKPVGDETEEVIIDPVQLVWDFIDLINEYAKCPHLLEYKGPLPDKGDNKKERNRIYYLNNKIYAEQQKMQKALLTFVNKYGLFNIDKDNEIALCYDEETILKLSNGLQVPAIVNSTHPEKVVTSKYDQDSPFVVRNFKVSAYEEYIKPFFPDMPAAEAVRLKGEARVSRYVECMEDILQNKRILACTEYVAGIDKQNKSPLFMHGMNAVLFFKKDEPVYDVPYRSLIEYCHIMLFLNEIGGKKKKIGICHYKLCHSPHFRNSKYCCDECRDRANKHTTKKPAKKGDQNNG